MKREIDKTKLINELRICRIEALQNDFNMQKVASKETDKRIIKKAKRVWLKNQRKINKTLNKIERNMLKI